MKGSTDDIFLKEELAKLVQLTGDGNDLGMAWIPRIDGTKEGEVVGKTIFVYSPDQSQAVETLRHEFVDYLVCKAIEPYQELFNALLSVLSEKAYRKKEEIVESVLKMLECPLSHKDLAVL